MAPWEISWLLIFVPLALLIVRLAVSRNREFQADATAVRLTRNPAGLLTALRVLERDPHPPVHLPAAISHLCIALLSRGGGWPARLEEEFYADGLILTPAARAAVWRTARRQPFWRLPLVWLFLFVAGGGAARPLVALTKGLVGLCGTHPPLEERIRRVEKMAGTAPGKRP